MLVQPKAQFYQNSRASSRGCVVAFKDDRLPIPWIERKPSFPLLLLSLLPSVNRLPPSWRSHSFLQSVILLLPLVVPSFTSFIQSLFAEGRLPRGLSIELERDFGSCCGALTRQRLRCALALRQFQPQTLVECTGQAPLAELVRSGKNARENNHQEHPPESRTDSFTPSPRAVKK